MKQFLRLLLAASVIAFAVSMTAVSCGKTADPNNNNNNNNANNSGGGNNGGDGNGGSGGDGNGGSGGSGGGGTPTIPPTVISVENIDASVAELKDGTNIELKASGFPTTAINASIANTTLTSFTTAPGASLRRAFDLVIAGGVAGGAAATAGLVLVDIGSRANANAFSLGNITSTLGGYTDLERKEGLRNITPGATAFGNTAIFRTGWSVYGIFMNDAAPTDAASAAPDAVPFSFSATAATHPILICLITVTTVTNGNSGNAGSLLNTTVLTGGQKASCYVGASGAAFTGANATAWLNTAASNTFKKKFNIAAMGIRTDAKTVGNIGLTAADKSAAIRDGITTTEMAELTAANPSAYKKFSVTIK